MNNRLRLYAQLLQNRMFLCALIFLAAAVGVQANSGGIVGRTTGAGTTGCSGGGCHGTTESSTTLINLVGGAGTITMTPGQTRSFAITVAHPSAAAAGINISIKNGAGQNFGTFTAGTGLRISSGELTHQSPQALSGLPPTATFSFQWTAPATAGAYTLRAAGNAVNLMNGADPGDAWRLLAPVTINVVGLQLTAPNGNEIWCRGGSQTIQWSSSGLDNVRLEYAPDGSSWQTIVASVPASTGSYNWAIPLSLPPGGNYKVRISDVLNPGTTDESNAAFSIGTTPNITGHPKADSVCPGGQKTLSAQVDNVAFYTYQWFKDNSQINGANTITYTINSATAADAGNYHVRITGCATSLNTDAANLKIMAPPAITLHPMDAQVCSGTPVTLRAAASGNGLRYQWKRNGSNVNGATQPTYTFTVTNNNVGNFTVEVTGACSPKATSNAAIVSVATAPQLSRAQPDTSLCIGSQAALTVEAALGGMTYEWKRNGTLIAGTTGPTLSIPSFSTADTGTVSVVVSNDCNGKTTHSFRLSVKPETKITDQPKAIETVAGQNIMLSVAATGANLRYQWKKDGTAIEGGVQANLEIAQAKKSDEGSYTCEVIGDCGTVETEAAAVSVIGSTGPVLALAANTAALGCVKQGSSEQFVLPAWIKNTGDAPLTVSGVDVTGAHASDFTIATSQWPATIAAGGSLDLAVTFAPSAAGIRNAAAAFSSNSTGTPQISELSGVGCLSEVGIRSIVFDSTKIGMMRDSVVRLCNTSDAPFVVVSISVSAEPAFSLVSNDPLPKSLQPGECVEATVRFAPNRDGAFHGLLTLMAGAEPHFIALVGGSSSTVGVIEDAQTAMFDVYPNPGNGVISVVCPPALSSKAGEMIVYDVLGAEVARLNPSAGAFPAVYQWQVGMSAVPVGSYIGVLRLDGRIYALSIVVSP